MTCFYMYNFQAAIMENKAYNYYDEHSAQILKIPITNFKGVVFL